MISEMIRVYLEETPTLVETMKQSLEKQDWDTLKRAAHSIVPSFSTVGIEDEYALMARSIQDMAGNKENPEKIGELISKIDDVCRQASSELQRELTVL